jgi:hypothetical protein
MLLTVDVPPDAAKRGGGDIVRGKIVLANIFTSRPETTAALDRFGLKIDKQFVENERVSPRLGILFEVCQETPHDQAEAISSLTAIWNATTNEVIKAAEPPSPLLFELGAKPEVRPQMQLPYNKSLAWALWNSTVRSALLLIVASCAVVLLPRWTARLVSLGVLGQAIETVCIAIFVCSGLLAIAFLFASIVAILWLGNEKRSGTYAIKNTLNCPHCGYRFTARDCPAADVPFSCICCERTVAPESNRTTQGRLFRLCAAIFKFPVQGS